MAFVFQETIEQNHNIFTNFVFLRKNKNEKNSLQNCCSISMSYVLCVMCRRIRRPKTQIEWIAAAFRPKELWKSIADQYCKYEATPTLSLPVMSLKPIASPLKCRGICVNTICDSIAWFTIIGHNLCLQRTGANVVFDIEMETDDTRHEHTDSPSADRRLNGSEKLSQ